MPSPVYRADPAEAVTEVALEGLTILYHRPSGATHILAPPAPQILAALRASPADAATILQRMGAAFTIAEADAPSLVAARLEELERAGLVWRA